MKFQILTLSFLSFFLCRVNGQNLFLPDTIIPVTVNGNVLENGFAGGLNFPIFSTIDLNGDGIKDLLVIDRSGSTTTRISTYINVGTPNAVSYKYAPYYRKFFPEMNNWALLVDYNCDGKEDIFTSTSGGMAVYKNDYTASNGLKFTKMTELLHSVYFSPPPVNLWVSPVNIPAFADIDGDGDMDILTFGLGGFQVEYHINKSLETYGHCDSLTFQLGTACWGQFSLDAFTNSAILGQSCPFKPVLIPHEDVDKNNLHGGSSILVIDLDNDSVKDMIMGDLLGNNLLALFNGGTQAVAEMTSQDTLYPPGYPVNITTYAAPMFLDVNNDGVNDLIVAPTYLNNYNGIWYYENNGTNTLPAFNFVKNAFMQDQMIDMGEGAYPVFFDYDGDGLLDIVSGNYGYFDPSASYPSSLHLFKNTGTATAPSFELITNDFANTLSLGLNGGYPTFGDLDG
ncbi:MAG: FG-GAP repeat domain-containing protein, partial [Bacteroidia bacterium]